MASFPRPCRAIGYPSKQVPMEDGVPGVLSRMAENEPPKMVAQYRAPMVMRPETGVMVKVKGTIKATAMVAVNPGKAPAMMPKTMAISMKSIFCSVNIATMDSIKICMVIVVSLVCLDG
ncbi:MAG: hypothetical protein FD137_2006 [Spirochaetes bacterium]|nr:MAG: hypothetical protein FD137_2006 [Spirochaetota bacterium]